ncbi:MAG: FAD-linked oxidase C-terminal domain-containing protein [Desulfotignum sp.]
MNPFSNASKPSTQIQKDLTALLGTDQCLFDLEDRWTYAFDAGADQAVPLGVVFAHTPADVCKVMQYAATQRIAVVPRGAGSGLTGGAVPAMGGIVLVLERMNRILEIDTDNLCATVETGVITGTLQKAAEKKGLFYPPDPASAGFSTIGGNIAENAGGMRAAKYGVTKQYVLGLEVVLPDGRLVTLGSKCIKDVVGYSMTELFVGSEGTLGVITKAIVRLVPLPETLKTLAVSFPDIQSAGQVVPMLLKTGVTPCTLEFIDRFCLEAVKKTGLSDPVASLISSDTGAMLLIELDGDSDAVAKEAATVRQICGQCGATGIHSAKNPAEREQLWEVRRSIHGALAGLCLHWLEEDIAVPPASIPEMLEKLTALAREQHLRILSFGHFADGNIHLSVSEADAPLSPQRAGEVTQRIFSLTKDLGGRIAAEHGIGLAKKEFLDVNLDDATLDLAFQIKKMIDPHGILNPGKIFPQHLWDKGFEKP